MYLVVDLAELSMNASYNKQSQNKGGNVDSEDQQNFVAYNTQVVFDRTGAVIARWDGRDLHKL